MAVPGMAGIVEGNADILSESILKTYEGRV